MTRLLRDPLGDLRHARVARPRVADGALLLDARRLDLLAERAILPLGLVELLRGRRLLVEQPTRALVRALREVALHRQHRRPVVRTPTRAIGRRALGAGLRALEGELRRVDHAERARLAPPAALPSG